MEAALTELIELASKDSENVSVLLAMATAFMTTKQTPKARNQLKRIAKLPYTVQEADEFERAWRAKRYAYTGLSVCGAPNVTQTMV